MLHKMVESMARCASYYCLWHHRGGAYINGEEGEAAIPTISTAKSPPSRMSCQNDSRLQSWPQRAITILHPRPQHMHSNAEGDTACDA